MIVLSHRGYWKTVDEKNSKTAFERSFQHGFGTETDVRDNNGCLFVSHDMPTGNEMTLEGLLNLLTDRTLPLAINIKADGLAAHLKKIMQGYGVSDWFVFDMSVPDMRNYLEAGIPVFTRMSEVEREPVWFDQAAGIWLDAFTDTWYDAELIAALLCRDKRVCVVSPELHGREAEPLWEELRPLASHPHLLLCTDYPESARKYFGETK